MGGWIDEWMDRWMNEWMDGWMYILRIQLRGIV